MSAWPERAARVLEREALTVIADRKSDPDERAGARSFLLRSGSGVPDLSRLSNAELNVLEAIQDRAAGRPPRDLTELRDAILEMAVAIAPAPIAPALAPPDVDVDVAADLAP